MKNLWNEQDAARFPGELGQRVYSSRLLGADPTLVLHGGGNTSVKLTETDLFGDPVDVLYVKGSGWDLASIEAAGYAPVRLAPLRRMAELSSLPDLTMMEQLRLHTLVVGAPTPSVEAILHAILPHRYVDHTHADAVVTVTNTTDGEARIREIYGDEVVVIPYVMPGFDLARTCARVFRADAHAGTLGMVLMNHGVFSFGETARESYERMIDLVGRAEDYLAQHHAWDLPPERPGAPRALETARVAELRANVSELAGGPCIVALHDGARERSFVQREDLAQIALQGPATPDHVIRTKRLPLIGKDVAAYAQSYRDYFEEHAPGARTPVTMLDPAPRVILEPELGMFTVGRKAGDARIVADIYRHTMSVIERAALLGGYRSLPARDLFDVEYWELEQAKLARGGESPAFTGEVTVITGAASGIGRACVDAFLDRGAAVVGLDVDETVTDLVKGDAFLGFVCDITREDRVEEALTRAVRRFGGVDMLVLNAGVFPGGRPVADLSLAEWRRVHGVNVDANLTLLRAAHPLLRRAPRKGRVVVMGSKNVPAPGPGAAAYSASKAALVQLARVTALEWAGDGIRVNILHPDAVFDTGIWTEAVLAGRAQHYGLSVAEYKRRNLLHTEVASRDVAEFAAAMCGPLFARTTGAQVPVDGGSDRVV